MIDTLTARRKYCTLIPLWKNIIIVKKTKIIDINFQQRKSGKLKLTSIPDITYFNAHEDEKEGSTNSLYSSKGKGKLTS